MDLAAADSGGWALRDHTARPGTPFVLFRFLRRFGDPHAHTARGPKMRFGVGGGRNDMIVIFTSFIRVWSAETGVGPRRTQTNTLTQSVCMQK